MESQQCQNSITLTFFSKLVIYALLFGVSQDLVGLCDLFEPVLCISVAVLVWVELEGHLPVGFLDLIFIGIRGDTEDFVEVLACGFDGQAGCFRLRLGAFLWRQEQSDIRSFTFHIFIHKKTVCICL